MSDCQDPATRPDPIHAAKPDAPVPFQRPQAPAHRAKCPECVWREGPFTDPVAAGAALMAHVERKHEKLVEIVRGRPMHPGNEAWIRNACNGLMQQVARLEGAMKGSRLVGPDGKGTEINVPALLVEHVRLSSRALLGMGDILLEMRTGRPHLVPVQKEAAAAAAGAADPDPKGAIAAP
jgi:hypothetical protein